MLRSQCLLGPASVSARSRCRRSPTRIRAEWGPRAGGGPDAFKGWLDLKQAVST